MVRNKKMNNQNENNQNENITIWIYLVLKIGIIVLTVFGVVGLGIRYTRCCNISNISRKGHTYI